ncbi:MAG TPA: hypothetical protein VJS92_08030 [Candidatus Polarisedimenticolaceae bacterium]|nr:hypothetical protein [Candidatus Polarisedimenticolaceae bacterium]
MPQILVIREEPAAAGYGSVLERDGYRVQIAESLTEGLERVDVVCPDAVILDVAVEDPASHDALEILLGRCPRIPVLQVTAADLVELGPSAVQADARLTRPDAATLQRAVRRLLAPEAA